MDGGCNPPNAASIAITSITQGPESEPIWLRTYYYVQLMGCSSWILTLGRKMYSCTSRIRSSLSLCKCGLEPPKALPWIRFHEASVASHRLLKLPITQENLFIWNGAHRLPVMTHHRSFFWIWTCKSFPCCFQSVFVFFFFRIASTYFSNPRGVFWSFKLRFPLQRSCMSGLHQTSIETFNIEMWPLC